MKILESMVDGLIRQVASINDSQFSFVPGRGTTHEYLWAAASGEMPSHEQTAVPRESI